MCGACLPILRERGGVWSGTRRGSWLKCRAPRLRRDVAAVRLTIAGQHPPDARVLTRVTHVGSRTTTERSAPLVSVPVSEISLPCGTARWVEGSWRRFLRDETSDARERSRWRGPHGRVRAADGGSKDHCGNGNDSVHGTFHLRGEGWRVLPLLDDVALPGLHGERSTLSRFGNHADASVLPVLSRLGRGISDRVGAANV